MNDRLYGRQSDFTVFVVSEVNQLRQDVGLHNLRSDPVCNEPEVAAHAVPDFTLCVLTQSQRDRQNFLSDCLRVKLTRDFADQAAGGFSGIDSLLDLSFADSDDNDFTFDDVGRKKVDGVEQSLQPGVGHDRVLAVDGRQNSAEKRVGK